MANLTSRALSLTQVKPSLTLAPVYTTRRSWSAASMKNISSPLSLSITPFFSISCPKRGYFASSTLFRSLVPLGAVRGNVRFKMGRWSKRPDAKKSLLKPRKLRHPELEVMIGIEESLPEDPEITNIAMKLKIDLPMAMALTFTHLDSANFQTRDASITNISKFETVEVSLLLCNDDFIQKLNKEWRDEDHPTDVLSMSSRSREIDIHALMLGNIAISVETAARQAEERGHTLLDEVRILMVHGLLHLLGFDHEISSMAKEEMEKEEEFVLSTLKWAGKGLIKSVYDTFINACLNEADRDVVKEVLPFRQKISCIICDMDGTLLNSKSEISMRTLEALNEAIAMGVRIIIATGKSRPAVMKAFKGTNLAGKGSIITESSPGVFLQGLIVHGRQGREIYRLNLDRNICKEILSYSLEHRIPAVAFSLNRCFTVFEHPLVDSLHEIYHEPKAQVIPSIEQILSSYEIQKLLFLSTAEEISSTLRPYWSEATKGQVTVVQALPDMLEIVPLGSSKGNGVKILLDHLGVSEKEVMAIGDGENDIEMLKLASIGVALSNGSDKAKAVADVIGSTNDDDGAAEAIYKYVL